MTVTGDRRRRRPNRNWAQRARWGLLVTALALGTTLVGTALLSYLSTGRTAAAVTRTMASDTLSAVRNAVLETASPQPGTMAAILAGMQERGLRYAGLVYQDGRQVAAGDSSAPVVWHQPALSGPPGQFGADPSSWPPLFGSGPRPPGWPAGPPDRRPPPPPPPMGPPSELRSEPLPSFPPAGVEVSPVAPDRVRASAWLRPLPGPGDWTDRMSGWRERPERETQDRALLVIEFEPFLAKEMSSRALLTLGTGLVTTLVLLAAALTFWRFSCRAEAAAQEAERDRQLRTLGQMSAVLGHELRNPLASLKGHAQLLLEKLPPSHPGRRGAETVVGEAVRLEELAGQIIEFVRTDTVQPQDANPLDVAAAAIDAAGIARVALSCEGEIPRWLLDPRRIEQVLVNLIRNARDASPDDTGIRVVVRTSGRDLIFDVEDRGEGLPPGDEDRAFEPFYTRRVKGTGLGLAIARQIVEGHGGALSARNRPDGGAVFEILLPPMPDTPQRPAGREAEA